MKKCSLILIGACAALVGGDMMLHGMSAEAIVNTVDQRLIQRVHTFGFHGILQDRLNDDVIRDVAEGFLGKVLTYYEVKRDAVDQLSYQRVLGVVKNELRLGAFSTGSCFDSEQEQVKIALIENVWDECTEDGVFDITVCERMPELFDLLLLSGANFEKTGSDGLRPLHVAAHKGSLCLAERLLKIDVEPMPRMYMDATPVHLAALSGNIRIMKALWFSGACFDLETVNGLRPLIGAIRKKNVAMVCYLLALGVEILKDEQKLLGLYLPELRYRELFAKQRGEIAQWVNAYAQAHGCKLEEKTTDLIALFVTSNFENLAERSDVGTTVDGLMEECAVRAQGIEVAGERKKVGGKSAQGCGTEGTERVQKKRRVHWKT